MFDLVYRSLCAVLYNYVPMSGHPGGSISSGRFVAGILFDAMDYDVSNPDREDADICSYAAGHKALGLYAMWALRNEVARIGAPELLPRDTKLQLRLEDLLGFRRNPITIDAALQEIQLQAARRTPDARDAVRASVDGRVRAWAWRPRSGSRSARSTTGAPNAPRVHIVEGEGGMTPGRVYEAMAAAGTASLANAIMHIDWNQASIDSNHVCRDGETPGDYVQWNPMEFAYLHDWNVIFVPEGRSFQQIIAAQRKARAIENGQPTAIVYRTTKGWKYGIEGRLSHGAGHKLCSDGFYEAVQPLLDLTGDSFPSCEASCQRCGGGSKRRRHGTVPVGRPPRREKGAREQGDRYAPHSRAD